MAEQWMVGKWVRRTYRIGSKYHVVESIFLREVLTKCGKYMADIADKGNALQVVDPMQTGTPIETYQKCKGCFPR